MVKTRCGVGRKRASARDRLDALRASAASARALGTDLTPWTRVLELVLTPCGRRPQPRPRTRSRRRRPSIPTREPTQYVDDRGSQLARPCAGSRACGTTFMLPSGPRGPPDGDHLALLRRHVIVCVHGCTPQGGHTIVLSARAFAANARKGPSRALATINARKASTPFGVRRAAFTARQYGRWRAHKRA
jgi:hypothetical protein